MFLLPYCGQAPFLNGSLPPVYCRLHTKLTACPPVASFLPEPVIFVSYMQGFHFEHTIYLYLLAALPLLAAVFLLYMRWKRRVMKKMGNPALVKELTTGYSPARAAVHAALALAALACCILALANPRRPGHSQNISRKGIDVVFALDVSKSMLAEDVKPSRLERARLLINRLSEQLVNDRVALVLFAGNAYLQMPLTTDHATARILVNNAAPQSAPTQGTAIAEALRLSATAFSTKDRKYKAVVLVTDGEDHDGGATAAAAALKDSGVLVCTVGIGSPEGSPVMDPDTHDFKKDKDGRNVISKLNTALLGEVAAAGGGKYLLHTDTDAAVKQLAKELSRMEGRAIADKTFLNYDSWYWICLLTALLLLVTGWLLPEAKTIRSRKLKLA